MSVWCTSHLGYGRVFNDGASMFITAARVQTGPYTPSRMQRRRLVDVSFEKPLKCVTVLRYGCFYIVIYILCCSCSHFEMFLADILARPLVLKRL